MNAASSNPASEASARLLEVVRGLWVESHPGRPPPVFGLDARLDRDLGLDSLHRVELALRLERVFERRLADDTLARAERLADLLDALTGATGQDVAPAGPATSAPTAIAGEPREAATLLDVLAWHVARHPERRHVSFLASDTQTETLAYGELDRRARATAAGLQRLGLEPGRAVALMLPSSLEFFVAYCGILLAGGVPVPIYPPLRPSQLEEHLRRQAGILANCRAVVLVTVPEAKLVSRLLQAELTGLGHVVTPAELEAASGPLRAHPAGPGDIAFIQYTSGSTGSPKGVVLTHANLLANVRAMGEAAGARSEDVFVSWLPLYHDMGLIGAWMSSLYFGLHLVLMSPLSFLARPSRWLWAIHRHRGTVSAAPNFAYELCASRVEEREMEGLDLSSWRWAFNGAEAVSAETLERFAGRFAAHGLDAGALAPVYGLAECALDLTFPLDRRGVLVDHVDREALMHAGRAEPVPPEHPQALKVVACGKALPGYGLRIADGEGGELPERRQGRILFRGPSATSGYFDNAEATAALFEGEWLDSGDLGYLAEGELHVTGRSKDVIIRAGHNVHPYELEAAVGEVPGVRKGCVAVFGVPGASGTERMVVVAETRETEPGERERMRREIERLSGELTGSAAEEVVLAAPHAVLKTSSGKIRRAATREAYLQGALGGGRRALWLQVTRLALRGARVRARQALLEAARWSYAAWAWTVFGLVGALGLLGTVLVPGVPRRRRLAGRLARLAAAATAVRIDTGGMHALAPGRGVIAVANHASYLDALVLLAVLPDHLAFVAKGEFRDQPVMRRLLEAVGARFVERFDAARGVEDARALSEGLAGGESLLFFPEGTFQRRPGVLPFRMGAFVLACGRGLPVVPIGLRGTREMLPADVWRPRPGRVSVSVGEPCLPSGQDWSAAVALRETARASVIALCGEPDGALAAPGPGAAFGQPSS